MILLACVDVNAFVVVKLPLVYSVGHQSIIEPKFDLQLNNWHNVCSMVMIYFWITVSLLIVCPSILRNPLLLSLIWLTVWTTEPWVISAPLQHLKIQEWIEETGCYKGILQQDVHLASPKAISKCSESSLFFWFAKIWFTSSIFII